MWRLASEREDQVVLDLCLGLYKEDPSDRPVLREGILNTFKELRQSPIRGRCVVFERDHQILGYALLASFWSNELAGEICIVDELFVRKEARGAGIASELFKEIMSNRSVWPHLPVAIELEVTPKNEHAMKLYKNLGFKPKKNGSMRLEG
ncbi:MAG: GNAT family N-acetyltransferase [Xanthomonadaceae bacterium]|nr:GNAT family N-acetyltransferase [Xanthomonadaceae bacterium]